MTEPILSDYDNQYRIYDSFAKKMERLIGELLMEKSIKVHYISGRSKDRESLKNKIMSKAGKYANLTDITDLAGVRIITYLESDVDIVADLIIAEFEIDKENSVDKRKLQTNEFGYKSLHYVISLNSPRKDVTEYKSFNDLKCEIQIRSILQHAWAEIEHDLGYKSKNSVPEVYQRDFNRLAALLETADKEFDRLKTHLIGYEEVVAKLIKDAPQDVDINQASLHAFLKSNRVLLLIRALAENNNITIYESKDLTYSLQKFEYLGIKTIKQLEGCINKNEIKLIQFANSFIQMTISNDIQKVFSLTKLPENLPFTIFQHFYAAQSLDKEYIMGYMGDAGSNLDQTVRSNLAEAFIQMYKALGGTNPSNS
ncbi:(p)ppGpp synthetase [Pseudoflavitalea sp. X16]|uniref:GTP pyrophosphokinase n=1 Tax=Paraflavitalea devenefica TaxID=2716334 RepID=UPI0014248EBC|nr:(p)ppGpp synthetase [Paraflavitalea devenefica]NII27730.1 (p)ppGpp synthetase [Paraflavitalea devenefica]